MNRADPLAILLAALALASPSSSSAAAASAAAASASDAAAAARLRGGDRPAERRGLELAKRRGLQEILPQQPTYLSTWYFCDDSPDYDCYADFGLPSCCTNAGEECPVDPPPCDAAAAAVPAAVPAASPGAGGGGGALDGDVFGSIFDSVLGSLLGGSSDGADPNAECSFCPTSGVANLQQELPQSDGATCGDAALQAADLTSADSQCSDVQAVQALCCSQEVMGGILEDVLGDTPALQDLLSPDVELPTLDQDLVNDALGMLQDATGEGGDADAILEGSLGEGSGDLSGENFTEGVAPSVEDGADGAGAIANAGETLGINLTDLPSIGLEDIANATAGLLQDGLVDLGEALQNLTDALPDALPDGSGLPDLADALGGSPDGSATDGASVASASSDPADEPLASAIDEAIANAGETLGINLTDLPSIGLEDIANATAGLLQDGLADLGEALQNLTDALPDALPDGSGLQDLADALQNATDLADLPAQLPEDGSAAPGASYCAYAPDDRCYDGGWPSCCLDDGEVCPDERPGCDDPDRTPQAVPEGAVGGGAVEDGGGAGDGGVAPDGGDGDADAPPPPPADDAAGSGGETGTAAAVPGGDGAADGDGAAGGNADVSAEGVAFREPAEDRAESAAYGGRGVGVGVATAAALWLSAAMVG